MPMFVSVNQEIAQIIWTDSSVKTDPAVCNSLRRLMVRKKS